MASKRKLQEYRSRKTKRPFHPKQAMHITVRSEKARGELSLASKKMAGWIRNYIPCLARKLNICLYHFSNNGTHLHFVLKTQDQKNLSAFLRAVGGTVARKVLGAERNRPKGQGFWDGRPYSRVLTWGREFKNALRYVQRNLLESQGSLIYASRDKRLGKKVRAYIEKTFLLERAEQKDLFSGQMRFVF